MAKEVKYSFYRPHRRVTEDNLHQDPITGKTVPMPSMAKQEFQNECDINNVVKQFKPHHMQQLLAMNLASGAYADLPDSYDYQESLHLVQEAERQFFTVPAKVRDRFGQDPAQFLAFINNPANLEEARALGLAKPAPTPPQPLEVKVVNPEPPKKAE